MNHLMQQITKAWVVHSIIDYAVGVPPWWLMLFLCEPLPQCCRQICRVRGFIQATYSGAATHVQWVMMFDCLNTWLGISAECVLVSTTPIANVGSGRILGCWHMYPRCPLTQDWYSLDWAHSPAWMLYGDKGGMFTDSGPLLQCFSQLA